MKKETTKQLNIAMFGHKRVPSREGGIEVVVEQLATRMSQVGNNVTLLNRKGHHVSGKQYDAEGKSDLENVKIVTVPTIDKRGLAALSSSFFAAIRAAVGRYDIVHIHAEGPAAMIWIPKLFGKRCIVTIHGLDWKRDKWANGLGSKYIHFGEVMAARFADEIIVLSDSVRDYFKETYGRDTVVIPNGIEEHRPIAANIIKQEYGLNKNDYILYLGRIVPEKGIKLLLEAYNNINCDKKLVIAGGVSDTSDYAQECYALAENNENIIFTGFVQGELLAELYSNAYIYVLPSNLEGMPLSLLEAMSYGNCCLTSDIPECINVVLDKGITFVSGDGDDLKQKLTALVNSPDTVELYKAEASQYICDKYTWDSVVAKTLELYRDK